MSAGDEPALPDFSASWSSGALRSWPISSVAWDGARGKIEPEDILQEVGVEIARTADAEVSPIVPGAILLAGCATSPNAGSSTPTAEFSGSETQRRRAR